MRLYPSHWLWLSDYLLKKTTVVRANKMEMEPPNSSQFGKLATGERKLPGAVVEDSRELHLDVGAGADHQQHHGEEGIEVEQRRLAKSDKGTWAGLREIHGKGRSARDGSLPWCSPPSFPVAGHRRSETRWLGGSRNLDLRARGGTVACGKGKRNDCGTVSSPGFYFQYK